VDLAPARRPSGSPDTTIGYWLPAGVSRKPLQFEASDGARVDGWGLIPSGRPKGGRPAVLAIHGGPKTAYGASFLLEFQILAGADRGAVLQPQGIGRVRRRMAHASMATMGSGITWT
jgi:poly(3-hydroxybutyrate) depolymerase